jgi:23S rRNA (guanosine2251-2'-O)-methyltransferase
MLLYGKNSIAERLKANPKTIRKIFLLKDFDDSAILHLIKKAGITVKELKKSQPAGIRDDVNNQGVIAEVDEFSYSSFDDLLDSQKENGSLIFLDRLCDPQNLGSIMRTAACLGDFGIVISKHKACPVTDTVLRVACGAENYVKMAVVSNFPTAMLEAKRSGFWIAGAVAEGGQDLRKVSFAFPLCIVLGSEEKGVRYGVDKQLDLRVTIPMAAPVSFNVGVAAAVVCYEIAKQRVESRK